MPQWKQLKQLSIHAAPYVVKMTNGEEHYYGTLGEITANHRSRVTSVWDRKFKTFLDLNALWTNHKRKIAKNTGTPPTA